MYNFFHFSVTNLLKDLESKSLKCSKSQFLSHFRKTEEFYKSGALDKQLVYGRWKIVTESLFFLPLRGGAKFPSSWMLAGLRNYLVRRPKIATWSQGEQRQPANSHVFQPSQATCQICDWRKLQMPPAQLPFDCNHSRSQARTAQLIQSSKKCEEE